MRFVLRSRQLGENNAYDEGLRDRSQDALQAHRQHSRWALQSYGPGAVTYRGVDLYAEKEY